MSVSLVVIRLELAGHSPVPADFGFSAAAAACLEGKSPGEKTAIIHQHLGRREMTDVIIETMKASPGEASAMDPINWSDWIITRLNPLGPEQPAGRQVCFHVGDSTGVHGC